MLECRATRLVKGRIKIIDCETGQVIVTLEAENFKNANQQKKTAREIVKGINSIWGYGKKA